MLSNEHVATRSNSTRWLTILLIAAFSLRAAVGIGVQVYLDRQPDRRFLIEGDANGYWELGRKIASGDDYAVHIPPRHVMRMPGFPLLLALTGGNLWITRILLAAVGTLACGLVFLLAREWTDERISLIACAIVAISPPLLGFSVLVLSETLFAATMLGGLVAASRTLKFGENESETTRSIRWAFLTGLLIAIGSYVRPGWILAGPLFAIVLVAFASRRIKAAGYGVLVLAGMVVALSPWIIRNYHVTDGHLVPTTLWAGPSLYDGLNPDATGDSDMSFFERDHFLDDMSEFEMDRRYRALAWQFVRENPGRTIYLAFAKQARYWKPWPNAAQFQRWWLIAGCSLWFVAFYLPAAIGTIQSRTRFQLLLVTLGPILYFAGIHAVFVGSIRYRLPAEYPLSILTAMGVLALWNRFRRTAREE